MAMQKIKVNGRILEIVKEHDMAQYPNTAKHIKRGFDLKGPRNAYYMLSEYKDGAWFCMSLNGARVERYAEVEFMEES